MIKFYRALSVFALLFALMACEGESKSNSSVKETGKCGPRESFSFGLYPTYYGSISTKREENRLLVSQAGERERNSAAEANKILAQQNDSSESIANNIGKANVQIKSEIMSMDNTSIADTVVEKLNKKISDLVQYYYTNKERLCAKNVGINRVSRNYDLAETLSSANSDIANISRDVSYLVKGIVFSQQAVEKMANPSQEALNFATVVKSKIATASGLGRKIKEVDSVIPSDIDKKSQAEKIHSRAKSLQCQWFLNDLGGKEVDGVILENLLVSIYNSWSVKNADVDSSTQATVNELVLKAKSAFSMVNKKSEFSRYCNY